MNPMNTEVYTVLGMHNGMLYPMTGEFQSALRFTPTRIERAMRKYLKDRGNSLATFECFGIIRGRPLFETVSGMHMSMTETVNF
jgi:hypothetical protein